MTDNTQVTAKRILIVEDDDDLSNLLHDLLVRNGFQDITIVNNGDKLSKILHLKETQAPDVLILDFRLPGQSGLYLLPQIKNAWPSTRIIVYTGLEEKNHELLEVLPFIDRLLKKTVPISSVIQSVKEMAG
ncbi:MAG: hypothetical protein A2036_03580 [Omnitrophica bacterium GWA2_50_21]|nr:MAG: hypothetical protein A2036_03580 [Omnitrophica bacterium GWA2_50_21]